MRLLHPQRIEMPPEVTHQLREAFSLDGDEMDLILLTPLPKSLLDTARFLPI